MHSSAILSACLAVTSMAAPTFLGDASRDISGIVNRVGNDLTQILDSDHSCDASKIKLPESELPSPNGQKAVYVAIGRGTQNYTCALSSADSKPEAVGAVATLFDATCLAADDSDKMAQLPNTALQITQNSDIESELSHTKMDLLGHHFFQQTTPVFNLDTTAQRQKGIAFTKVQKKVDAPANADKGDNGAVEWLYLSTIDGTVGDYKSVYRVNTAGGAAPKTCENAPSEITVQYAANYYFFEDS